MKLLHEPGLAEARLADNQRKLALTFLRAIPASAEKIEFLLTAKEGG
jgi:hypothetical protein